MIKILKILSSIFFYLYNPFCVVFAALAIYFGYWYLSFPILGLAIAFLFFYLKTHEKEISKYSERLNKH